MTSNNNFIFRDNEVFRYFICYVIKRNLLSPNKLFEFRTLCSKWKQTIEYESSEVERLLKYQQEIVKKLFYDTNTYDQYHYKRKIIKNTLIPWFPKYKELQIPFINSCYMDLDFDDEPEKVYIVCEENIPNEFRIFIQEYYNSPTVYVKLYPPEIIKKSIMEHKNKLRDYLINMSDGKLELYGRIFLVPLCYSKHYKIHYKDKQFVNILCFINVVDKELESDFPEMHERYIVLTIELEDLENNEFHYELLQKYLMSISKSIVSDNSQDKIPDYYYPQDVAQNAQSFDKCFDLLIQNQKFNL